MSVVGRPGPARFSAGMRPDLAYDIWWSLESSKYPTSRHLARRDGKVMIMGYHPDTEDYAMDGVVWGKAVEFCRKTTERERKAGRLPRGYVYRLPTEAEWEYACRAGTGGEFNTEGHMKYFCNSEIAKGSQTVGEGRKPNAWGLYDMHGNVYEWCLDWYGPYDKAAKTYPTGPRAGTRKVARGGCALSGKVPSGHEKDYSKQIRFLRNAARNHFNPELPLGILGFRVVLGPEVVGHHTTR